MSSVIISGDTSGAITLSAPAVSGTTTLTLPATTGTMLNDATVGVCRAWVNFAGTGTVTIRASFNVTSITDNGTADYTVNFTTAMTDANFAATGLANAAGNMYVKISTYAAGSLRFVTGSDSANADATTVSIAVFR
jgi:hypothetical protein